MCWWCLDRLVIRISSHLHAVSANTCMGMGEQKRGWRLWEMMSGRTVVWLELYSYLDRKTNEWWVHQQCCLMTQRGTEWRGRRSQLLSTPSTKDTSEARTWWPSRKLERCWDLLKSWCPLFSVSPRVILDRLLGHTSWYLWVCVTVRLKATISLNTFS